MNEEVTTSRVEIHLSRTPPMTRLARAAGVSEVAVTGTVLTCLVSGSFQPLLEALVGYEVVHLRSTAADPSASPSIGEARLAPQGVNDSAC